jgi:hypothetical protein
VIINRDVGYRICARLCYTHLASRDDARFIRTTHFYLHCVCVLVLFGSNLLIACGCIVGTWGVRLRCVSLRTVPSSPCALAPDAVFPGTCSSRGVLVGSPSAGGGTPGPLPSLPLCSLPFLFPSLFLRFSVSLQIRIRSRTPSMTQGHKTRI